MTALITPEITAFIGRKDDPIHSVVTRRDIQKYAVAVGSRIKKHLCGDEAPPLFHLCLFWPIVPLAKLKVDGLVNDPFLPQFPLNRAMAGGVEVEYHRPIVPGDTLIATRELTDIYEKMGRQGPLLFYEITRSIDDDQAGAVVTEKTTQIMR